VKPAVFDYFRPQSLDEALCHLDRYGASARLIAGGQSLIPMMNLRIAKPEVLIDLGGIRELAGISDQGAHIHIGAMTRQSALLTDATVQSRLPLLARAASHIGHFQTRSRGTVGGSLAHADPSAELSLIAVTLGAEFKLVSANGTRCVTAANFFVDGLTTVISEDEILTEISFLACTPDSIFAFEEFARRHGDFALASAAVQCSPAMGRVQVGLGAIGSVPHFCTNLSAAMSQRGFEPSTVDAMIADEIDRIAPITDLNASGDYRRHLAGILLNDCLQQVFQT
jgi:aerobic carbon-monoxide dehydrogenase medium subunit